MFPNCFRKNNTLKFFLKNSSLHGMKYVGDEQKHWFERLAWCILIGAFAAFPIKTVIDIWKTWQDTPVIITTVSRPFTISKLPVPAITYCQDFLISTDTRNGITNGMNMTKEDKTILCGVMTIVLGYGFQSNLDCDNFLDNWGENQTQNGIDDRSFYRMFDKLVITDQEYIRNDKTPFMLGMRFDEPLICYDMLTHNGLCTTCSSLPLSQIYRNDTFLHSFHNNPDDYEVIADFTGFPILNSSKFDVPYPSLVRRPMNGLSVNDWNITNLERDNIEINPRSNRWYTIHSPWDVPNPFMRWHYSKDFRNHELQVFIEPDQTLIDDNLMLPAESRRCYLPHEKRLKYFKYYTYQNCKMECLTDKVLNDCGCVLYYMPHNESTPICFGDLRCADDILDQVNVQRTLTCECFASCNQTGYKFVSLDAIPDRDSSRLIVVFIDDIYYPQVREESDTLESFVETSVTYLDMFLGLSLISIVEILYYSILMLLEFLIVENVGKAD
ncbi:pickpocket protein 28-like [Nilaparvata lugens]|uniref:pickpocket protein 28-like n=1 Tax=Nilaparvata lugens TaxID=108931 RepID=UPI00193DAB9E|nr:pickpocket protein 28-like [Nilaparvata lugens]